MSLWNCLSECDYISRGPKAFRSISIKCDHHHEYCLKSFNVKNSSLIKKLLEENNFEWTEAKKYISTLHKREKSKSNLLSWFKNRKIHTTLLLLQTFSFQCKHFVNLVHQKEFLTCSFIKYAYAQYDIYKFCLYFFNNGITWIIYKQIFVLIVVQKLIQSILVYIFI